MSSSADFYVLVGHSNPVFTNYFDAHGIAYHVLRDTKRYTQTDAHSELIDFSDTAAVIAAINRLHPRPTCVFTMYEQYIAAAAGINQHLGNNYALDPVAAAVATDKLLMREAFAKAPQSISPPFARIDSKSQLLTFAKTNGFPVIVKPANLSKSLLVTRCDTPDQLQSAYHELTAEAPKLYKRLTNNLPPRFIVESFMPGSVHTVLGFADASGNVVLADQIADNVTAREAGFDDTFIFSRTTPSRLAAEDQKALLECSRLGVQAMGLRSCAAHIELVLTKDGPRLIEIGARVGGYRANMYRYASGIDVIGATLTAYGGKLPKLKASKQNYYRAIEIFPAQKGAFESIKRYDQAAQLPSIVSARLKSKPGDVVGRASQGFKAVAVFELHNSSKEQIEKDYAFLQTLQVVTS